MMRDWQKRLEHAHRVVDEVLYGMFVHDIVRAMARSRGTLEHLFILITFGDLVGVPILPPYYAMRLIPFVVPEINGWRRRLLRERDIVDAIF
jgi:hypothetical protein